MIQLNIQATDVGNLLAQLQSLTTALRPLVVATLSPDDRYANVKVDAVSGATVGGLTGAVVGMAKDVDQQTPTPAAAPAPAKGGKGGKKSVDAKADNSKKFMLFDPVANTMTSHATAAAYLEALTKKVTSMSVVDEIDAFAAANEATLSGMTDAERQPCDEVIENHLASLGVKPEVDGGDGLNEPAPVPEKIDPNTVKNTLREVVQTKGEAVAAELLKKVGATTWKEVKEDKLGELYHSALTALGKAPQPAASASLFD